MSYKTLTCQKEDHLAVISLAGPFNDQAKMERLSGELADLCNETALDDDTWVIILTGTGEDPFSLGMDFIETAPIANDGPVRKFFSLAGPLAALDRPVIAAINCDALGQGLEVALACDIRIASETARFGLPHIWRGLIPWDGGTQRLLRLVGLGKAMEMVLCGGIIDAPEACRIGLVNRVVSPDMLERKAMGLAKEMVSKAPLALRYAKEAVRMGMDLTLEQGLRMEADLYFLLHTTADRAEGLNHYLLKQVDLYYD